MTIDSISGSTITLTTALAFNHYGKSKPDIVDGGMTLDTRTVVAHLTRNIIVTTDNDSWGYTIYNYKATVKIDKDEKTLSGKSVLSGVMLEKGSQVDTFDATLVADGND